MPFVLTDWRQINLSSRSRAAAPQGQPAFYLVAYITSSCFRPVPLAPGYWVLPHPAPCLKVTFRLDTHPAMVTVLEMGAARHFLRMQQLAKTQEERAQLLQPTLEINPR